MHALIFLLILYFQYHRNIHHYALKIIIPLKLLFQNELSCVEQILFLILVQYFQLINLIGNQRIDEKGILGNVS
jgi:hypothetical protein